MKHYFSHDTNARNDEKILMLRAEHGWEGYGLYWALIEMLFECARNDVFESEGMKLRMDKLKGLAIGLSVDEKRLRSVVDFCIHEGLFVADDEYFWSKSLIRRTEAFKTISEKRAEAGRKGGKAKAKDKHLPSNSQANDKQLPSKPEALKETKREKNKLKEKEEDKESSRLPSANNPPVPLDELMMFFNSLNFPQVRKLSDQRKKHLRQRVRTWGVDGLKEIWTKASATPFLTGNNDRSWTATFDWLIKESNLIKVHEGAYERNGQSDFERRAKKLEEMFGDESN